MLQRVDAMESELSALVESLRTGANRLNADLSLLSGNMGELYDASGRASREPAAAPIVEDLDIVDEVAPAPAPPPAPPPRPPRLPASPPPRPAAPRRRCGPAAGAGAATTTTTTSRAPA